MLLQNIVDSKHKRVARLKKLAPVDELINIIEGNTDFVPFKFSNALKKNNFSLIAETKKASPSQGVLIEKYDPRDIVRHYEALGAHAISVLTEEEYFQGSILDLKKASNSTNLPLLRKDFIFDEYEVYEAKAYGASAILLIARILGNEHLKSLISTATFLGLDVLLEVHDEKDLEMALDSEAAIIGINSRDLDTLKIDLSIIDALIGKIPDDKLIVAESGISSANELRHLAKIGANAALIGTTLLKGGRSAEEITDFIKEIN